MLVSKINPLYHVENTYYIKRIWYVLHEVVLAWDQGREREREAWQEPIHILWRDSYDAITMVAGCFEVTVHLKPTTPCMMHWRMAIIIMRYWKFCTI